MMARFCLAFFLIISVPLVALADTSEFLVRVFTGEDVTPPGVPTLLSVTPVATTQIDVTWSAVTDDVLLSGYVLHRDGVAIATTTLTTYMDTGLLPETLYEYDVYAFDSAGNISSTSNALSTTTLAIPVVPPVATSTGSGPTATLVFQLLNLDITTARNSALLQFETSLPSRFALRWGRTDSYDDGFVINDTYQRRHSALVNELEPGTSYLFELIGYSPAGREVVLERGEFVTAEPAISSPSNVRNLRVATTEDNATLTWQMPPELMGAKVRIVRSHLGFPNGLYDGTVVFEGSGDSFVDTKAFNNYDKQYYSVFVIATDGAVSSGAVVSAVKRSSIIPRPIEPGDGTDQGSTTQVSDIETELPNIDITESIPNFNFSTEQINILQGVNKFTFKSEDIALASDKPFVVSIPFGALPDNLKSIVVTLLDPTDSGRSYSFLLRINKDRTAYEAAIAALDVTGWSRLQVEIFDYERKIVGRYQKKLTFSYSVESQTEVIFPDKIITLSKSFFAGIWPIATVAFLIFFLLYRRSRQTEDKL